MDEVSPWQQLGYQKDLLAIFIFLGEGFIYDEKSILKGYMYFIYNQIIL
jgi:hypothetical protein